MKKKIADKVDKRKARRLKRRMAKKLKFINLDEGKLLYPDPTPEMIDHVKQVKRLMNSHLLNEKNENRHSAIITQLLDQREVDWIRGGAVSQHQHEQSERRPAD